MHDSGKRQDFSTGAKRDAMEGKTRPDLISPFADERVGDHLGAGAEKYDERNWEKGIPFSRCVASLSRHLMQFKMGMRNEDHLAAIVCNAQFIMHYQEMIKRNVLPASLNDMPDYSYRIPVFQSMSKCLNAGPQTIAKGALVAYKESETMDADYGRELADQNKEVKGIIFPDDNKCRTLPVCDICGSKDVKYYRQDLERAYCSLCYHNNRIDLKPVIIWS